MLNWVSQRHLSILDLRHAQPGRGGESGGPVCTREQASGYQTRHAAQAGGLFGYSILDDKEQPAAEEKSCFAAIADLLYWLSVAIVRQMNFSAEGHLQRINHQLVDLYNPSGHAIGIWGCGT